MTNIQITRTITPAQFRVIANHFGDPCTANFRIDVDGIVTFEKWGDNAVRSWTVYGDGETTCEQRGLDGDGWQDVAP